MASSCGNVTGARRPATALADGVARREGGVGSPPRDAEKPGSSGLEKPRSRHPTPRTRDICASRDASHRRRVGAESKGNVCPAGQTLHMAFSCGNVAATGQPWATSAEGLLMCGPGRARRREMPGNWAVRGSRNRKTAIPGRERVISVHVTIRPTIPGRRTGHTRDGEPSTHCVKYCFTDGTWLSIRFSGREPLLRLATEMQEGSEAQRTADVVMNDEVLRLRC
jgi:hypothetical protein